MPEPLEDVRIGPATVLYGRERGKYPDANCVLVEGERRVLLDTTPGLVERGREAVGDVDDILLTHAHEDHQAGNFLWPGAGVWAHERDVEGLRSLEGMLDIFTRVPERRERLRGLLLETYHYVERPDARAFVDGHVFDLGAGVTVEAVHTPGHTHGHCAFLVEPASLLFLGDVDLSSFGPFYGDETGSLIEFEQTLEKLAALEAEHYLSGHHIGLVDRSTYLERLERYHDKIRERDRRLVEFLALPHDLDDIAEHRFVYRPPGRRAERGDRRKGDDGTAPHPPHPTRRRRRWSRSASTRRPSNRPADRRQTMAYLDRDGVHIYYEVQGDGPTLLLSHGYSATAAMWDRQVERFRDRYRVVTWDMRGHGRSDYPEDASLYSEEATVGDMAALLDEVDAQKALVGGLSLGGYMSLAFHHAKAERCAALLLFDTGPGYKSDAPRDAWNANAHRRADDLESKGFAALGGSREVRARNHRDTLGLARAARGMLAQRDDRIIRSLPGISVPTLVLVGADDEPFLAATDYMAGKIPSSTKVVHPGGRACVEHRPARGVRGGRARLPRHPAVRLRAARMPWHLAQLNVARMRFALESPEMQGFVDQLERINALAEASPGFVWRLEGEGGDATDIRILDDPSLLVNMSVWESIETLRGFTYRSAHGDVWRERAQWFEPPRQAHSVLWWVPEGHLPTVAEAESRLAAAAGAGPRSRSLRLRPSVSATGRLTRRCRLRRSGGCDRFACHPMRGPAPAVARGSRPSAARRRRSRASSRCTGCRKAGTAK